MDIRHERAARIQCSGCFSRTDAKRRHPAVRSFKLFMLLILHDMHSSNSRLGRNGSVRSASLTYQLYISSELMTDLTRAADTAITTKSSFSRAQIYSF